LISRIVHKVIGLKRSGLRGEGVEPIGASPGPIKSRKLIIRKIIKIPWLVLSKLVVGSETRVLEPVCPEPLSGLRETDGGNVEPSEPRS
jgi:hypothetical protein